MTASEPHEQRLTEFLASEAHGLTATVVGGRVAPPVVLLARAHRAFAVAGLVSTVLVDHASPAREATALASSSPTRHVLSSIPSSVRS
ncbi:hypothetical protein [Streptomyces beigongshangae]|uniref:hypothetical protein n=1 Tax=Streptomyces beigongshangae TaxID=2841597 RepID=UPI001C85A9D9|nr:hypothetical protein [Streptomyces sp. REN17]